MAQYDEGMTVGELIEVLKTLPQDWPVVYEWDTFCGMAGISKADIVAVENMRYFDEPFVLFSSSWQECDDDGKCWLSEESQLDLKIREIDGISKAQRPSADD